MSPRDCWRSYCNFWQHLASLLWTPGCNPRKPRHKARRAAEICSLTLWVAEGKGLMANPLLEPVHEAAQSTWSASTSARSAFDCRPLHRGEVAKSSMRHGVQGQSLSWMRPARFRWRSRLRQYGYIQTDPLLSRQSASTARIAAPGRP